MLYMNEYEIDAAARRHDPASVAGMAARFLAAFRDEVNAHSDGWPYWSPPVRAAAQLQQLVMHPDSATPQAYAKALAPIRAFYTRRGNAAGMKMPAVA